MYLLYSILLAIGFALMLPLFMLRREKYAAGFLERLGSYPRFEHDERPVIWLHCVSVGETNAARPLVEQFSKSFPEHRLVISTTTKTGQAHARNIFRSEADAVIYFPFDWKFSVKKALANYKPSLILLMETEIWPRFIREAKKSGARIVIVNGRLSEQALSRYSHVRAFMRVILGDIDLALMQDESDAKRIVSLGIDVAKVIVTGNLKFDLMADAFENTLTGEFRKRFAIDGERSLIVAASTHEPEEKYVVDALTGKLGRSCRLLIAPRHPERFDDVERLVSERGFSVCRRSRPPAQSDRDADVILLDSIGELRAAYPFADIVFVGGSLIPHGGQSILEPAASGRAIVTGPFTHNFDAVVREFVHRGAILQLPAGTTVETLSEAFESLLDDPAKREALGQNASRVMSQNRGATMRTLDELRKISGTGKARSGALPATSRSQ